MASIKETLDAAMNIDGAAGVAIVDLGSGMALGISGDSPNLDVEAAANADILKAKYRVLQTLGRKDTIEDILITLGQRYHLLRPVGSAQGIMLYLNLHRSQANLALARHKLSQIERELVV